MKNSLCSIAVLALMAAFPALPVAAQEVPESDADLLDFRQSQAGAPTGWVDPEINNRRKCFDRPGRPEWVVNQPDGMDWRRDLIERYVYLQKTRLIIETGECTCKTFYPDFEDYRAEIDQLVSQFPDNAEDMTAADHDEVRQVVRTITRRRSRMAVESGRVCRGF